MIYLHAPKLYRVTDVMLKGESFKDPDNLYIAMQVWKGYCGM